MTSEAPEICAMEPTCARCMYRHGDSAYPTPSTPVSLQLDVQLLLLHRLMS